MVLESKTKILMMLLHFITIKISTSSDSIMEAYKIFQVVFWQLKATVGSWNTKPGKSKQSMASNAM